MANIGNINLHICVLTQAGSFPPQVSIVKVLLLTAGSEPALRQALSGFPAKLHDQHFNASPMEKYK